MTKFRKQGRGPSTRNLVIVIVVVATLYLAREIFIPLAFAVTLALILAPAVAWLVKLHINRVLAALSMVLVTVAFVGLIGYVIFNQFVQVLGELPSYQENVHRKIQAMREPASGALGRATESVKELSKELSNTPSTPNTPSAGPAVQRDSGTPKNAKSDPGQPLPVHVVSEPAGELQYLRSLTQPFLAPLGILAIVLIFTVFLLIDQDDLRNRLLRLAGLGRLNLTTQALDDATRRVSRYLMLQFLVNAGFGALCGIGLYLIGLPYAALWGTIGAILRLVPYIGSPLAAVLPFTLALAVFDGWHAPLLVLALFVILEIITANFVEPWLYGLHTGITSLALLVTSVFWAIFWGPAGLILSTPLTVCLVVLGHHIPQLAFLRILLGDEPVLPPEAQVYQRLLAMDGPGARAVVDQHLANNSMLQLYDSVMIPTLTMIERDRRKDSLDPDREEFIFLNLWGMVSDFADLNPKDDGRPQRAKHVRRILCLPADRQSDEITASILAQLLAGTDCVAVALPNDPQLQTLRHLASPTEDDVIFISAVAPFAFGPARALMGRLRRRFPDTKIVVGLWGFAGDTRRALQHFQPLRPDRVVTTFESAMAWVAGAEAAAEESRNPEPVGQRY